jgi:hypothetical protein
MKLYQLPGLVSGEDSGEQRFIQVSTRIPPQVRIKQHWTICDCGL